MEDHSLAAIRQRAAAVSAVQADWDETKAAFHDRWALLELVGRLQDAYRELETEANTLLAERDAAEATNAELRRIGAEQGDMLARLTGRKIEYLQAENAALRKIVLAIADASVYHDSKGGMLIVSDPDGLVQRARTARAMKPNLGPSSERG